MGIVPDEGFRLIELPILEEGFGRVRMGRIRGI
jgi:hypothetical protein